MNELEDIMKKITAKDIEQEYSILISSFERFLKSLLSQLENILDDEVTLGFPIQYRIKKLKSLLQKIESGRFNVKKSIKEVQDIIGLRIILIFKKDVETVCQIIRDNLNVIKEYSSEEKLLENQFGYSSIHFVVKIPESWRAVPTFKGLEDFYAEIQVRTLSQHTWAEASNTLQYKQEDNTPGKLLRSISRVSALLETVDLEFERLLIERVNYQTEISQGIKTQQILNVDIVANILNEKLPPETKTGDENYAQLTTDLKHFDINTNDELITLIDTYLKEAIKQDYEFSQGLLYSDDLLEKTRAEKGVFFNQIGLIRQMLEIKHGEAWRKYIPNIRG